MTSRFYNIKNVPDYYQDEDIRETFGGKALGLVKMNRLALPVPPAFLIPTQHSMDYQIMPTTVVNIVEKNLREHIAHLEAETGRKFGAATKANFPLLVSVRSGAPISMPGMMDTVLNVGLNDKSTKVLAGHTNPTFAWESYRRFIQSYATIVLGLSKEPFERLSKAAEHFSAGGAITEKMNQHLVSKFLLLCEGKFPQSVEEQLLESTLAVFRSWNSDRAKAYRKVENISEFLGTGVVVQSMVFGNLNDNSGTGVYFTRDPQTGHSVAYGDFLKNAQGEDVVDGSRQTMSIFEMSIPFPEQYSDLYKIGTKLEKDYQDMCDIEFTIEDGKLYILQVRKGKRSAKAARRIPLELLASNVITVARALELLPLKAEEATEQVEVNSDGFDFIGKGLVACEGDVEGVIALSNKAATELAAAGHNVILVREKTDPDDMEGIIASKAIVTFTGGLVSHAAVIARSWNKPCIVGLGSKMSKNYYVNDYSIAIGHDTYTDGDKIIIRASENGAVYFKKNV